MVERIIDLVTRDIGWTIRHGVSRSGFGKDKLADARLRWSVASRFVGEGILVPMSTKQLCRMPRAAV